jgi:hypothetical protein
MTTRTHYQLLVRLDAGDALLLWYTDEQDGVVATPDEHVPCFASEAALLDFARALRVSVSEHRPVLHDLDAVQAWARTPSAKTIDARALLVAWNFFGDLARSLPARARPFLAADAGKDALYDKLFLASSPDPTERAAGRAALSAVAWSASEVASLAALMEQGLALFRAARVHRH